ncbi:3-keto-5-aminohexanoate cleavage protein [Azospirillum thermophilum]|uniref:3-keto-5-aminohexanoate cleavage enzyme n=1 Tax=Azospirillum thermophilum TaxID=2202148 RepID=A0A2S2CWB4_9PROT|nr:3-keto-5-aminohexanoate cleavage protein [Azospirillum thermophilum]AWK88771.1 3-keto-5-aminohexanoate cleavage enzyme [Azospirillum thermophilum]
MIVQACINGARPRGYHPRLPLSPQEVADDAAACIAAGAAEIHLHVRGPDGLESLEPDAVDATLLAVRARAPGSFVGLSTGAWIEPSDERRIQLIAGWRSLPDHASVNLSEATAPDVIALLHRRGIGIEAGLASVLDAERLVSLGLAPLCLRVLIEIEEQETEEAMAAADAILSVLSAAGVTKPVLLHGVDETVWAFVERAAREGYSTRVGLEDGFLLPDGLPADGNAALVAAAARTMGRNRP